MIEQNSGSGLIFTIETYTMWGVTTVVDGEEICNHWGMEVTTDIWLIDWHYDLDTEVMVVHGGVEVADVWVGIWLVKEKDYVKFWSFLWK